jgi:hypothetical protein
MQLFYANQSIRNLRDISNATHDKPIPSIGTIFNIISKSLVFGIVGCIATHNELICVFFKLNIGNKYGLCSKLKKCPGISLFRDVSRDDDSIFRFQNILFGNLVVVS